MTESTNVVRAVESSLANLQLGNHARLAGQEPSHTTKPPLIRRPLRGKILRGNSRVLCLTSCSSRTDSVSESSVRDKTHSVEIPRPMFQAEGPLTEAGILGERWRIESTIESITLLVRLCRLYGFDDASYSIQRTFDLWWNQSLKCGLVKFLKYKMAAFFAYYLKEPLPPLPPGLIRDFPQHLLCGSAGRFITLLMRSDKLRAREFSLAVLYLKGGLPRPSDVHVKQGVKDTFDILTETHFPTVCEELHFAVQPDTDHLCKQVRRTVHEIFGGKKFRLDDPRIFAPSLKANYTNNRVEYGTLGTLLDLGLLHEGVQDGAFVDLFAQEGDLVDGSFVPENENSVISINLELEGRVRCLFRDVYARARKAASTEPCETELVGLAEALKVRVISKGPPLTYFVLQPLQKFMHGVMRKHPTFALIGEPVTEQFIQKTFTGFPGYFLSADYSAATDMLDPRLSQEAVNSICDCCQIPQEFRRLFLQALTGHKVWRNKFQSKEQRWGQLMGSIVSFPILCIINAAICRMAFESSCQEPYTLHESLTKFRLERIPLCVNGDDALLRCNAIAFQKWKEFAKLAGLSPSVGKVYFHPRYANINSTSFHNGVLIPYVRAGLLMGMTRSSVPLKIDSRTQYEKDHEFLSNVGSRHTELLTSCPPDVRVWVHKLFCKVHKEILGKYPIPWYLPKSRGGLGMMSLFVDVNGVQTTEYLSVNDASSRIGPSREDLICAERQLQEMPKIPCFTTTVEYSARRAWSDSLPSLPQTWALPENEYFRACVGSQSLQFPVLDLAAYFLNPRSLIRSLDAAIHCRKEILSLKRFWYRSYAAAKRNPYTIVRDRVLEYNKFLPLLVATESDDSSSLDELD